MRIVHLQFLFIYINLKFKFVQLSFNTGVLDIATSHFNKFMADCMSAQLPCLIAF